MLFSSLFTTALCLAGVSAKVRSFARSNRPSSALPDRYASLQARAVPNPTHTTGTPTGPVTRTVVSAQQAQQAQQPQTVKSNRLTSLTYKIQNIVTKCHKKTSTHVENIKHHCRKEEEQEVIITSILVELEAILIIIKETLIEVKHCGQAPTPSGVPTNKPPTIIQIVYIVLEIIILIKVAILEIFQFFDVSIVHRHFGDCISQITSVISEIIVSINFHLQGSISILAQVGDQTLSTIARFGFGFDAIVDVVNNAST